MTPTEIRPVGRDNVADGDSPVLLTVAGSIAHIELNRPESLNSLNMALVAELERTVRVVSHSTDVNAVILSGKGRAFCAGGDVRAMANSGDHVEYIRQLADGSHAVIRLLDEMAKPLVACVHGAVAGAGLGYLCAADFVIAGESTRIKSAFIGVGASPDSGTSHVLPRIVGMRRALELTMLNRSLSAQEALEWGLVTSVHQDDAAQEAAFELARDLADQPPVALGLTRQVVRTAYENSLSRHLDIEASTIHEAVSTPEARFRIWAAGRRSAPLPS